MDLRHDWKALNEVLFQSQGSAPGFTVVAGGSSLVLLEEDDRAVDGVVSDGKAYGDIGTVGVSSSKQTLDGLGAKYGADQTVVLSKRVLDQCVIEAAQYGTNYFQQLEALRSGVLGQLGRKKDTVIVSRRHFVLDLFGGRLKRVLRRRFNVLLFIDQRPGLGQAALNFSYRAILLSYSNGQLDQFFEPDFSSLHENRLKNWHNESDAIGQYLESRYMMPCYGVLMHRDDWERCLEAAQAKRKPWRLFVRYHDDARAPVYPNGIFTKFLLATQRLMVYFGRL